MALCPRLLLENQYINDLTLRLARDRYSRRKLNFRISHNSNPLSYNSVCHCATCSEGSRSRNVLLYWEIVYHLIRTMSLIREFHVWPVIYITSFIRDFHVQVGFYTEFHSLLYDKKLERLSIVVHRNDCGRFRIEVHMRPNWLGR